MMTGATAPFDAVFERDILDALGLGRGDFRSQPDADRGPDKKCRHRAPAGKT